MVRAMKAALIRTLAVALLVVPFIQACAGDPEGDIVDIGKSCSAASDCEHLCVAVSGQPTGQCSIQCVAETDCPSFMDCVTSSSTGDRRCFDPGGLVTSTLAVQCTRACGDVNYFCSSDAVTDADEAVCDAWCGSATDTERQQLIDCVNASERYESACPATECMLLTR